MAEISDALLVAQCRDGDPRALADLYRRHAPALLAYLERLCGGRAEAEDALQETFLRVLQGRSDYREEGRFRAWLFTIATRLEFDRRRDARRHEELAPAVVLAASPSPPENPARTVAHRELVAAVQSALADLPPTYAQAFFLRVHEDWSYREIAEVCGEPEGTLRSRVHHALRRVRQLLDPGPAVGTTRQPHKEKQP